MTVDSRPGDLIYAPEERVPPRLAWIVSLQHVGVMIVSTITLPLLLSGLLGLAPAETARVVSATLLVSALGTFLQARRIGPVGSGLLTVMGTSFAFLQPLLLAGQAGGLALMAGMALASAPLPLLLAPFLHRLRGIFTPLISGTVIMLIGLTLMPVALRGILAPAGAAAPPWSGLVVAIVVLLVIAGLRIWGGARLRPVLLVAGIAAGCLLCATAGWMSLPGPAAGPPVMLPRLFPHGLAFDASLLAPFVLVYLVITLEAMGDLTAAMHYSGLPGRGPEYWRRLRGGILADGITGIAAAMSGAFPQTTYSQNNGVIRLTGVASRHLGPLVAVMLAVAGLFPMVAHVISAIPSAVVAAAALPLFGLVILAGARIIAATQPRRREFVIVGLSLAAGVLPVWQPEVVSTLPPGLTALLGAGIVTGSVAALLLDRLVPGRRAAASGEAARRLPE